jgi:dGTPase
MPPANREDRRHGGDSVDQRREFERDRDRVIYSSAFHRLAGITQIARAGEESVFHTRQQHTIKVAQVGRRLAQHLMRTQHELAEQAGVDDEVVEAACLIHDLGHPPFGHIGETTLNKLITPDNRDGFEGNAQSFRIITKLAVRKEFYTGMNLTRATLAATLKYPWYRGDEGAPEYKKWSVYHAEKDDFEFALPNQLSRHKTIEADLMDWADDIAYSVHDLEDFHRCSAVPWNDIFSPAGKLRIIERAKAKNGEIGDYEAAFDALQSAIYDVYSSVLDQKYEGTKRQRWVLRGMTSQLIGLYINSISISQNEDNFILEIVPKARLQVMILKQITWDYIISNPALSAQQFGYKRIIEDLYNIFKSESENHIPSFAPVRLHYFWDLMDQSPARFAADCVSSLSEAEALAMHARLMGFSSGSVLNPIVR